VNKGGTPTLALSLCALASIILVLTGTFDTLIAMGSILFVAVYLSGFASLLVLRRSEPRIPRPCNLWWYPWSTLAVSFASAAFLLRSALGDLRHSLFTAILIFLGYAASRLLVRKEAHSTV
jgi:basic amino acid/polyamine antiporter, APA family